MSVAPTLLLALATPTDAFVGDYFCTVYEEAGIASSHRYYAGPPSASAPESPYFYFRLRIDPIEGETDRYSLTELDYDGPGASRAAWHTRNSIFHSEYLGDGRRFTAVEDQAFAWFGKTRHPNEDGEFAFYQSGFAYAGGEDTHLRIYWGRCKPE